MTPRHLLAANLARALIESSTSQTDARTRCAEVLGEQPTWLDRMVEGILVHHPPPWHEDDLDTLLLAIEHAPQWRRAWLSTNPPRIRKLLVATKQMAPARIPGLESLVPALPTSGDLAHWLGITTGELLWHAGAGPYNDAEAPPKATHYRHRWVAKRSGGFRLLEAPKPAMCALQRKILRGILDQVAPHAATHGFRAGRSALTNALPHLEQRVVIRFDLRDFFLGIGAHRVCGVFKAMGYPPPTAALLAGLCSARAPRSLFMPRTGVYEFEQPTLTWSQRQPYLWPHLPQGAPTSPALANLCAYGLDARLQGLAAAFDARYTRYADDLTFSGGDELRRAAHRLEVTVGAIVLEEGFVLNHRKTRIMRRGARQVVTGVVVNVKPNVAREHYDHLKAMLHHARNIAPDITWRSQMRGHIAHVRSIHPARGDKLQRLFDAL